jgi:hypothetical protein
VLVHEAEARVCFIRHLASIDLDPQASFISLGGFSLFFVMSKTPDVLETFGNIGG